MVHTVSYDFCGLVDEYVRAFSEFERAGTAEEKRGQLEPAGAAGADFGTGGDASGGREFGGFGTIGWGWRAESRGSRKFLRLQLFDGY